MMEYLAHSARQGCPPQTYQRHVEGVLALAKNYAEAAAAFAQKDGAPLVSIVRSAAYGHDIGKLDEKNQQVLHRPEGERHLPVHHQDAGAALLVREEELAAYLVQSHHVGLKDADEEAFRDRLMFRDDDPETRARVDSTLERLERLHRQLIESPGAAAATKTQGDLSVFLRIALSCLADADHTDTARHYGQYPADDQAPALRPAERLARLNTWVDGLDNGDERSRLRREMYEACRNSAQSAGISACDGPVGSGKTTAIMAHLLWQAILRGSRRIFVVLPYTCIISQSVKRYRDYLVLPGEDPEKVVAELHHRADFEDVETRCMTALWRAPIIVTTAAAFFETLAANRPAALRRLHELPGSMIFVDESHAALPVRLLPVAWHWIKVLSEEWSCYWVMASGSLVRFWKTQDLFEEQAEVGELVSEELRQRLMCYEKRRVRFCWEPKPQSRQDLIAWAQRLPGPRLLIVNTVQTAAVLANDLRKTSGRERVEHLSTALTAEDREATLKRIEARLQDSKDWDWTLVATSCVEAGMELSFRTGFRELASLLSLLQAAGRIDRHGGLSGDAEIWSFKLQDDPMLTRNPSLKASASVLERLFTRGIEISPELCTDAIADELAFDDSGSQGRNKLWKLENECAFRTVAEDFVVIDSDTVTIVPDEAIAAQIRCGQADWRLLQKRCLSIPRKRARGYKLEAIKPDIYRWHLGYDGFLGYMAGIVEGIERRLGREKVER